MAKCRHTLVFLSDFRIIWIFFTTRLFIMSKNTERNEHKVIISWFKEQFPKAFPLKASNIKPLQLGIMDEILDYYDRLDYPPFSKKKLRSALNYYTASPSYLKTQVAGAMRVDLFGFDVEPVSDSQAEYAKERHQKYIEARKQTKEDEAQSTTNDISKLLEE